jgi:ribosome-associated toxin RatA of RatAB toxin-antitoxin module
MFDLVNDIDAYPQFLHWCSGARIESSTPEEVTASIDIGIAGISQKFRTRNRLTAPENGGAGRIAVSLVAGPFRRLEGVWTFEPLADGGSEVRLELEYELTLSPLRLVISPIFDEIARSQMGAFVRRADAIYADE